MRYSHWSAAMVIILTLSVLLAACQPTADSSTDVLPTLDSGFYELNIPSAHRDVDDAYSLAREWSPDAILIGVDVSVPPGERTEFVGFSFISKTNSKEHFTLSYKDDDVTPRVFDWNASYSSFREIELDRWLIDSAEAFEVAQRHGGQEHMLNTSGNIEVGLMLKVSIDNILVWTVGYRSLEGKGTLYIGVDATTGEFMWIDPP